MTQMTDIPEYGQFIKQHPPAPKDESFDDLVAATLKTIVKQAHALAQSIGAQPDEDRASMIERAQEDMRHVLAEFADPRGNAARLRILCDLLRLPLICAHERCRRSQSCRGQGHCFARVDVPEPVFARAAWLMMAARLPWITSGRAKERDAYEAWIAAMEAGCSRVGAERGHGRRPAPSP